MTNPIPEKDALGQTIPPPSKKGGDAGGGGGPLAGIITWIGDSYNGLYKIVLAPSMPTRSTVLLSIFMVLFGMIWAWGLAPTTFVGANPNRLNQASQDQWIQMVAVGYSAGKYSGENAVQLLNNIDNPIENIQRLINEKAGTPDADSLQVLLGDVQANPELVGTPTPKRPGIFGTIGAWLLPVIIVTLVVPIFLLLWRLLIYPNIVAGAIDQVKQMTDKDYAAQRKRDEEGRKAAQAAASAKRNMVVEADATLGEPIMKTLSIFSMGRDFDDSFEIELPLDQGGDFLGQAGATIAEAVAPDPVAIEMWLFDMFTQQDKKKVFITEAGYNDPSIRGRIEGALESPSDLVVARDGVKLIVDSDKLRLQGEMTALQVDANGRFQSFQMPIAAWRKDGVAPAPAGNLYAAPPSAPAVNLYAPPPAGAPDMSTYDDIQFDPPPQPPVGGRSMSDYDDIQFDPPPTMPSQNPLQPNPLQPPTLQPPSTGLQPLQPPPLRRNPPEDDPFGGTGDFTPLND